MDYIKKNSNFQDILLQLVLNDSSCQDDQFELLLSPIGQKIRKLAPRAKMTHFVFRLKIDPFFRSHEYSKDFDSALIVSYAKKSEKNNGAKIIALSLTIFARDAIEILSFFLYSSINCESKSQFLIAHQQKTVIDRTKIFLPLFFSGFLA